VPGAAGRCAGGAGSCDGDPPRAAVAADRVSAAACGARSVDPPERLDRLSGNGQASGKCNAGWCRSRRRIPQGCGRAPGAWSPAGDGHSASDVHWDGYGWVREVWICGSHLNPKR
jgi:hypothetical protein